MKFARLSIEFCSFWTHKNCVVVLAVQYNIVSNEIGRAVTIHTQIVKGKGSKRSKGQLRQKNTKTITTKSNVSYI